MTEEQNFILDRIREDPATGCWNWTRYVDPCGYGRFGKTGTNEVLAHRYAYLVFKGPLGDQHVCHTCDNPKCCNPDHLFLGTHQDNMRDRADKGRSRGAVGEKNAAAVLTAVKAVVISKALDLEDSTERRRALASMFGVTVGAVAKIATGRTWSSVTGRPKTYKGAK